MGLFYYMNSKKEDYNKLLVYYETRLKNLTNTPADIELKPLINDCINLLREIIQQK